MPAASSPITVEDAQSRILKGVTALPCETVALACAAGRVLGAPLSATLTQPPYRASAMDGYAVRAADISGAPVSLNVVGESAAGHGFEGAVQGGEAVRIFTGAPVPDDCDAIVIQENTKVSGSNVTILEGATDPGHIRGRGGDFTHGDILLEAGLTLSARHLTLAAAGGHADVPVRRRPRVGVLSTGDELVPPGASLGPDQIIASNEIGIAAMVTAFGGDPLRLGIARDSLESLADHIRRAREADILVTIGGASVGQHDLVSRALEAAGLELDFWKVLMRPGKPSLFGRLGSQRVLGVPGNPVSSLVCSRLFLVPMIRALLGQVSLPDGCSQQARLAAPVGVNGPRQHYLRGVLEPGETGTQVTAIERQDSSLLVPLCEANCLIVRPPRAPAAEIGENVTVLPVDF